MSWHMKLLLQCLTCSLCSLNGRCDDDDADDGQQQDQKQGLVTCPEALYMCDASHNSMIPIREPPLR